MAKKCGHKEILISDSILTCKFTATCLKCGKSAGGHKTINGAKKALKGSKS